MMQPMPVPAHKGSRSETWLNITKNHRW